MTDPAVEAVTRVLGCKRIDYPWFRDHEDEDHEYPDRCAVHSSKDWTDAGCHVAAEVVAALDPVMRQGVTLAHIEEQRAKGWPDIHPEDFCHRCGRPSPMWFASREDWLTATSAWAAKTGREGICCPSCFASMHAEQTGESTIWRFTPENADRG